MAKPYDATLKELVQAYPRDWLVTLEGLPPTVEVEVLAPDLSTVTAAVDLALRADDTLYLIDFQSAADAELPGRMPKYNVLAFDRYRLPVQSIAVLLPPRAELNAVGGAFEYRGPKGGLRFEYDLVRVWRHPVEEFLRGGPGVAPLALLGALPAEKQPDEVMPELARRAVDLIESETEGEQTGRLLTAMLILTGLKYKKGQLEDWFRGVPKMEESEGYQMILEKGIEKGKAEEARDFLLRFGRQHLGDPDEATRAALAAIADAERLNRMFQRVWDRSATGWADLLNTP